MKALVLRRRALGFALLVCALAASCSHPAAPPVAPAARPNVVVIVLDTVRPDYLSAYGHARPTSPFLEGFAASATRYDQAWSTSPWTLPAHASLFSGTLPAFHRATQSTEHVAADVPLLAERLQHEGYQTACLTNNNWISRTTGLDRGFELHREQWSIRDRRRSMGEGHPTVQALREWFAAARRPDAPFFLFVNLTDAHMPYLPHWEEAQPFFESKEAWLRAVNELFPDTGAALLARNYSGQPPDERQLGELRALYEGALLRTDRITEALVKLVDAHSDPRNTLVFVLSDHGENLGEHGQLSHIFNLYDTNLRIALLARGPGFAAGAHEARPVQITDVYPTILRAAGLAPEASCVGLDLRGALPNERALGASLERPVVSLGSFPEALLKSGALARFDRALEAARFRAGKQIAGSDGSTERYDLEHDPAELHPLDALDPALERETAQAIALARALWTARTKAEVQGSATKDGETRKGLKELGYVGGDK